MWVCPCRGFVPMMKKNVVPGITQGVVCAQGCTMQPPGLPWPMLFASGVFFLWVLLMGGVAGAAHHSPKPAGETGELVFATPIRQTIFTRYLTQVFRELGRRTGLTFRLVELPGKRCLVEANTGMVDGVPARVAGLDSAGYENLVGLSVSVHTVRHLVFVHRDDLGRMYDINALLGAVRNRDLVVAYMRGSVKARSLLQELPERNKVALEVPTQAFRMLAEKRIVAYLAGPGVVSMDLLKKLQDQNDCPEGMQHIVPAFVASRTQLFPYVHRKNKDMIPILEKVLCSMRSDGTLEKFRKSIFGTLYGE